MNKLITYGLALATLLTLFLAPVRAEEPAAPATAPAVESPASPLDGWTELVLEGRKFLVATGRSSIVRDPERGRVHVASVLRALGSPKFHDAWSVARPDASASCAWLEVSRGKKARAGFVDGAAEQATIVTLRAGAEDDGWGPPQIRSVAIGAGRLDAYALLAHLPRLFEGGRIALVTKDGETVIDVRAGPPARRFLRLRALDGEKGDARVLLLAVPLDLRAADGGETLLGLEGDTRLWVDRSSGALLEIEGKKPGVPGTIRLTLEGYRTSATNIAEFPWPRAVTAGTDIASILDGGGCIP